MAQKEFKEIVTSVGIVKIPSSLKARESAGVVGEICQVICLPIEQTARLMAKLGFEFPLTLESQPIVSAQIAEKLGSPIPTKIKSDTTKPTYDLIAIKERLLLDKSEKLKTQKLNRVVSDLNLVIDYMFIADADKTALKDFVAGK